MARKLNISGSMKLQDEENFGPNLVKSFPFSDSATLSDDQLEEILVTEHGLGGEVRGELTVKGQMLDGGRIRVSADLLLYEGTSEATDDLDGQVHTSFIVGAGQTLSKTVTASNTDEGDDDYAKVSLTCKNSPA